MNTTREFLNTCKEVCGSESPNKQMEQIIISPRSKKLIRVLRHLHLGTSRKLKKIDGSSDTNISWNVFKVQVYD